MHYHCEIVMPPTDDVIEAVVEKVLAPFKEGDDDKYGFWDWYVIGGRWAGSKFQATLDPAKLEQFHEALKEKNVTVSGLQAGKQELKPESQIPMVDALWNEFFPESNGRACPLFQHSNDQYKSESMLPDDVMRFGDVPLNLKCSRVIFAGPNYNETGIEAREMFTDSLYNGCTWENTDWDETFGGAIEKFHDKVKHGRDDWREKITPKDDWLVVTVDYHS